jgi:putative DNA primase/helicase
VWPDSNPDWTLIDRPPNSKVFALAEQTIRALVALSEDRPVRMRFDAVAQQMFYAWWTELEKTVRGAQDVMHPAMIAHLAKYRSLMPTLAALFELTARIDSGAGINSEVVISLESACQAGAYCEYLKSHAHRVYGCLVSPEVGAAQELSRHIRARHLPDLFTTRDVYRPHWRGLDVPEKAKAALEVLEGAGWIRRLELSQSPGRPADLWAINPEVYARGN